MAIHIVGNEQFEDDGDGGLRPVRRDTAPQQGLMPLAGAIGNDIIDEFEGVVSYYGSSDTLKYDMPDGKQYFIICKMTEGMRVQYENATQSDISFNRGSDNMAIRPDASKSRQELLKICVVGWKFARPNARGQMEWVAFSKRNFNGSRGPGSLEQWLEDGDPKMVNDVYLAARKYNPFLSEDMTSEMIMDEIIKLQEMHAEALKRESLGKSS